MIKLGNKARKVVRYEDVMTDLANIPVIQDYNHLTFKNNSEYAFARFMQVSKITKWSITIFFTNPDLIPNENI